MFASKEEVTLTSNYDNEKVRIKGKTNLQNNALSILSPCNYLTHQGRKATTHCNHCLAFAYLQAEEKRT